MDTKKLTGMDTTGCSDSFSDEVDRGQVLMDRLLGPSDRLTKLGKAMVLSTPTGMNIQVERSMALSADDIRRDDAGMEDERRRWRGLPPVERLVGQAFIDQHLCRPYERTMNLASPYGEGNHHRISWRRAWDVDREALTATHKPTGFVLAFTPCPEGGYTALPGCELPSFGPDGTLAMAQMFGLRELLKDGWEIFHTVMHKGK